jgi:RNA polymerase sigma factor (TIGR02999 family)
LTQEEPGQTLQATALVHEAYLRLVDVAQDRRWDSRGHYFAAAAEAMRRILVEHAGHKRRPKHDGGLRRTDLEGATLAEDAPTWIDLIALDEALTRLTAPEPIKATLVKLRYFAGLTVPEAADVLGISTASAEHHWTYTRSWLNCALTGTETAPES